MALGQATQPGADNGDIGTWMAHRWRDVSNLGAQAEVTGRDLWAQATRAGQNLTAPNPSDVVALGARFLNGGGDNNIVNTSARPSMSNGAQGTTVPSAQPQPTQFVPTPDAPTLADLRKQQAQFGNVRNNLDAQNSWMAWATLLPAAAGLGFELAPALGLGGAEAATPYSAMSFPDLEAWQAAAEAQLGRPLTAAEKTALRAAARLRWEQANGVRATELGAQVHHSDPLEWAHVKPNADPNRLANLWGLDEDVHNMATQAWRQFRQALGGRTPSQAEIMAQKLRVDHMVSPYVIRPGAPKP
jgi:hypothetical protein